MMQPRPHSDLTIVTVNHNNATGLLRTIESIRKLELRNFNYVVIDGGSNDGSLEVVKENSDIIETCISEPDHGIYDAMNKAGTIATGKYILFLNSGDYFANPHVLNEIDLETGEDLIYGNHTYFDPLSQKMDITRYGGGLELAFFWRTTIPQCSTFIKKSCLDSGKWFDLDYPIAADWVFFCKAVLERGCSTKHLDRTISIFELGGISTLQDNQSLVKAERDRFLRAFLPSFVYDHVIASEKVRGEKEELLVSIEALNHELNEHNQKRIKYHVAEILRRLKMRLGFV